MFGDSNFNSSDEEWVKPPWKVIGILVALVLGVLIVALTVYRIPIDGKLLTMTYEPTVTATRSFPPSEGTLPALTPTILSIDTIPPPPTDEESDITITELGGTWEGFTGEFHITFFLGPECKLNEKCGTFEIPEFSLSGDITFVNVDGDVYEFKATNLSSGQPGNDYEYLEILGDGTLKYFTTGHAGTSEAILYKK